jgi:hypothetical protein
MISGKLSEQAMIWGKWESESIGDWDRELVAPLPPARPPPITHSKNVTEHLQYSGPKVRREENVTLATYPSSVWFIFLLSCICFSLLT